MNETQMVALAPYLVLAATPVILLLILAFTREHGLIFSLTLLGLGAALGAVLFVNNSVKGAPIEVPPLLVIDRFALFFTGLLILTAAFVALLAFGYLERQEEAREEFYVLLLMATLGCAVLTASTHFASFFLGLELLSVSLYAMIAYTRSRERAVEAGLKYLVLAGTSSAFLLFGMALIYGETGTMRLGELARATALQGQGPWMAAGVSLLVVGIGFKLALVPFHLWTPDVYEGAPAPVAAFIATASKGAMFALLIRYFGPLKVHDSPQLLFLFALIAIASMFGGNLLGLMQDNVKRLLAYSSIAQLGYLIVAFLAGQSAAVEAVAIFLVAYFVTTLTAFGVIAVLSPGGRDLDKINDYRGLFWRRPWLAGILAFALFSLAGIPFTAGFVGKFFIVVAGAQRAMWALLIMLVVSSAIGLFYYLRVIVAMVDRSREPHEIQPEGWRWSVAGGVALVMLLALLVLWGVYPAPLIGWAKMAAEGVPF